MTTAVAHSDLKHLNVDPDLFEAIVAAVSGALEMCDCPVRCVGVTTVPAQDVGEITGMVGVHGQVSGFVTVNLTERFARRAVGGLLQDEFRELNAQVIDGVGEIANMIVGGVKSHLSSTPWSFPHITVPSVIMGQGYCISFARGLNYLRVSFEAQDPDAVVLTDRILQVSISLLRL